MAKTSFPLTPYQDPGQTLRNAGRMPVHAPQDQPLLSLPRILGNRQAKHLLQAKWQVAPAGDFYEQQADRVAEQVMGMSVTAVDDAPLVQRQCAACSTGGVPCVQCQDEQRRLQRKPLAETITTLNLGSLTEPRLKTDGVPSHGECRTSPSAVSADLASLPSGGQPLPASTRAFFEPRFGTDFGQVRVHTDTHAARAAQALQAQAFTLGPHVVFGSGYYSPDTDAGKKLLAHELTHVLQQRAAPSNQAQLQRTGVIQRTCLPMVTCPPLSIDIGGAWPSWEAAESCLQLDYRRNRPLNVIGYTNTWQFLTGIPGSPEAQDLDCFRGNLVARGSARSPGMFMAQPDIIDFTSTEIYEVTTINGVTLRRARLDANVLLASALAANVSMGCSGRAWHQGAWMPSPCYWLGGDMYMRVINDLGILVYQMLRDVSKEVVTAAILAAIAAAMRNAPRAATRRHPAMATATAAVAVVAILTTDANIAFASEGEDPIMAMLRHFDEQGVEVPEDIRAALESNPEVRERLRAAMEAGGTSSERSRRMTEEALRIIQEHRDEFTQEDLEALVTMMEQTVDTGASSSAELTVESLREQLRRIRSGEIPDPGAAEAEAEGEADRDTPTPEPAPGTTPALPESATPEAESYPGLSADARQRLAETAAPVRELFDAMIRGTGEGPRVSDEALARFLAIVPAGLTAEQSTTLRERLRPAAGETLDQVMESLRRAIASLTVSEESTTDRTEDTTSPPLEMEPAEADAAATAEEVLRHLAEIVRTHPEVYVDMQPGELQAVWSTRRVRDGRAPATLYGRSTDAESILVAGQCTIEIIEDTARMRRIRILSPTPLVDASGIIRVPAAQLSGVVLEQRVSRARR